MSGGIIFGLKKVRVSENVNDKGDESVRGISKV